MTDCLAIFLVKRARSLKTDFQNATIGSDEPSCFGSGESYRPEAAHTGQREPGVSLVRSPGSGSGRKRGRIIGRDHHRASEIVSRRRDQSVRHNSGRKWRRLLEADS